MDDKPAYDGAAFGGGGDTKEPSETDEFSTASILDPDDVIAHLRKLALSADQLDLASKFISDGHGTADDIISVEKFIAPAGAGTHIEKLISAGICGYN
jgi:hypothetical protein